MVRSCDWCSSENLMDLLALEVSGSTQYSHDGSHAVVIVVLATQLLRAQLVGCHNLACTFPCLHTITKFIYQQLHKCTKPNYLCFLAMCKAWLALEGNRNISGFTCWYPHE